MLIYSSNQFGDASWVDERIAAEDSVTIAHVFTFNSRMVTDEKNLVHSDERAFVLGVLEGDYYRINRDILGIKKDLLLFRSMKVSEKTFIASRGISIFRKIDNLIREPIIVGGDSEASIPFQDFERLLQNFPTSTEWTHYANARVENIIKDYLGIVSDSQKKLDQYLAKKRLIESPSRVEFLLDYEPRKFEYVRDELMEMLKKSDTYPERVWQRRIVEFLLLIFPKYIAVIENLQVKDFYSNPRKAKSRYVDLALIDANGTIDIIEIKKPFDNCLLSTNKYRDNYIPRTELSGSVMQVEKYIFYLSKWGRAGEVEIIKKRRKELPKSFELKITNPKAMIILGRDKDFANDQKFDFEIIKRKYTNVIDILTYDDLLRRLNNIIARIKRSRARKKTL